MRRSLYACFALIGLISAHADDATRRYDGVWTTTLSCPNSNGALGYSFRFASIVKDGVLHGEKGDKGQPGWMQLDGEIMQEGSADLYVQGLVGASPFAVGQRPAGTSYGYHLNSKFTNSSGKGMRVEGRPCTAVFTKDG
jgi:hypothetical protein